MPNTTGGKTALLLLLALTSITVSIAAAAEPAATTRKVAATKPVAWAPEVFPVSFWCGPPREFLTVERFRQIKDANFTYCLPSCGGASVEDNHKILAAAHAVGLKAFIADPRMPADAATAAQKSAIDAVVADYKDEPALAGYFIGDEPGAAAFPALARVVAHLREVDPAHPGFINLFPNYAPEWALGGTYDSYVENFITTVKPFAVSYDHYHFTNHGDRPGFFPNLDSVRRISSAHGLPFWNIVLLVNHFDYRLLSEAELRWEAMQSLAYGAKGILFFTYWQPGKEWGEAVINVDGTPTPHYPQITRVNREIGAIGKYLLNAKSLAAARFGQAEGTPVRTAAAFTAGYFEAGPTRYVLVANLDYRAAATVSPVLNTGGAAVQALDTSNDTWAPAAGASAEGKGEVTVPVKLEAGAAKLLRWTAAK